MAQIKLTGRAKGSVIELDAALPYDEGELGQITVEDAPPTREASPPEAAHALLGASPSEVPQGMDSPPRLSFDDMEAPRLAIAESRLPAHHEDIFGGE